MSTTIDLQWPDDFERRLALACVVAGVFAELGVKTLTMTDPRHCAAVVLITRETDLPAVLCSSAPGTIVSAGAGKPQLDLLIDAHHLRFAVDERYASSFGAISSS